MVKFIINRKINTSGLLGNVMRFKEDALQKTVDRANSEMEHMFCVHHPDYNNVIQADIGKDVQYVVIDACCEDFAKHLQETANS